jgi:hypothetical protein
MAKLRKSLTAENRWRDQPDDDWITFIEAADNIAVRLNVSTGRSEVTLRDLCASGEVRSARVKYDGDGDPLEVKTVRPSEWRTTEVDLEVTGSPMDSLVIEVSEDDLEYWLGQQGAAQPEDAPAIERRPRTTAMAIHWR